ncbi:MAG TPA: MFS transporter [Gemmatimonadales bacterium]|nr:MFS transporter [Gemmatimonadales bacterium]
MSEHCSTGPAGRSSPQGWAAWYALSLLAFGNLLSYLDRNIVFALFEPIKRDLGVTDAQLGWLGSAYAIVFSIGSLFAGVVSDLSSRRAVLAGGLALWSAFTAAGGLVRNYAQLFASRALVGIGQSSYLPAAQALLADYFPTRGRAQALGIFWVGLALGGVLAVYLGGVLTTALGWRDTLVVIGLPGVAFAALLWRLRDPAERPRLPLARSERAKFRITARVVWRVLAPLVLSLLLGTAAFGFLALFKGLPPEADTAAFGIVAGTGVAWTVFGWVRRLLKSQHLIPVGSPADVIDEMLDAGAMVLRTPTLIWLFIGGALTSAAMNALVAWSASFLQRELGLSLLEAASRIGPAGLLGGILGSWAGGRLGDTLMERLASGRVIAAALGFIIGAPLCVMMLLLTSPRFAAPLFFVVVFFYMWYNGPVAAVLFDVVPREVGATVMGAYVFFIHIAGDAIALPAIGALSDRIGLRAALLTCPLIGLLGGVVLLFAVFTVRRDMARVRTPAA